MRDRLVTLGLALGALFCFYTLFFSKAPPRLESSMPQSTEAGSDGYLLARRWLEQQRVPISSLRYRYDRLEDPVLIPADSGNVLLLTLPQQLPFQRQEWEALDRWVDAGNTLLVLAALDDTPKWAVGAGSLEPALSRVSDIHFQAEPRDASAVAALKEWIGPRPFTLLPVGEHPLMRGVESLQAISDLPASRWRIAYVLNPTMPLGIARPAESDHGAVWVRLHGRGQVILCTFASLFSNRLLTEADNARLLSNIIAWSRAGSGRVIFDDAHQGLVDFYDAEHFFADPRLHRTLLWLLLLWLLYVLGPQRLRSAPDRWQTVGETALLEASGRFYTAAVDAADARRALFENFFNPLRRRIGLPENGEPVWSWLDEQAAMTPEQRAELQDLYARVCAQQHVRLPYLHNFLTRLQRQLR